MCIRDRLKNVTSEHLQAFFDLLSFGGTYPDGSERKGYSKDYIRSFSAVLQPVSYTHLDVYKRQLYIDIISLFILHHEMTNYADLLFNSFRPVSYTHLARPIRYQRQVSDRKGKIFYTSITSLSHISKITGH